MRHMFSYVCLLLLVICCWHGMARHIKDKKKASDESSASHEHESSSHEHKLHSHEHESSSHEHKLHSHEHEPSSHEHESHSHSHESSSKEDSSSKEKKKPACTDGKQKGDETDIDCGGKKCPKCADRKSCKADSDCISGFCQAKKCAQQPTKPTKPTKPSTEKTTATSATPTSPKTVPTTLPETTTTEAPETESTTTEAPETESTTPEAPETEEVTTEAPETESTTTEAPETEEATTEALETEEATTEALETESATTEALETESATTEALETESATAEALEIESATASFTCDFNCENGGTCTSHNQCTCTTGFSGLTCEVQSVGLCLNDETFDTEPLLLITFGDGSAQYSSATPASFNFSTTYRQGFEPVTRDGMFSFVNSVHNDFNGAWHTGAIDHSEDDNGYMYLVNADYKPGQFYDGIVDNLCIGLRYEFSVYLANLCKSNNNIKPNVLFEVRSVGDNTLLAQLESGDVNAYDQLTWNKYGFSFIATSPSVNLLMISNAPGGSGNDLVIDDIALRVCAHAGAGFCPSN